MITTQPPLRDRVASVVVKVALCAATARYREAVIGCIRAGLGRGDLAEREACARRVEAWALTLGPAVTTHFVNGALGAADVVRQGR